jgi:hypothetical protein
VLVKTKSFMKYSNLVFSLFLLVCCGRSDRTDDPTRRNSSPMNAGNLAEVNLENIVCFPPSPQDGVAPFGTFSDVTFLFDSSDSTGKIIDTLLFNTPVNILKRFDNFLAVCTPEGKVGYIRNGDIYNTVFYGYGRKLSHYLVGLSKYGINEYWGSCIDKSHFKIVRINGEGKKEATYVDTLFCQNYEVKKLMYVALKNVHDSFHVSYSYYSEIGNGINQFIVDTGSITNLISVSSSGDGGVSNIAKVYLPVYMGGSKKVLLARDGVLSVDSNTGNVDTYPYPSNLKIPIEELIVVVQEEVEMVWNAEAGEQAYNADGSFVYDVYPSTPTFYRWDGSTLKEVRSADYK